MGEKINLEWDTRVFFFEHLKKTELEKNWAPKKTEPYFIEKLSLLEDFLDIF